MTPVWDIEGCFPAPQAAGTNTKGLYHLDGSSVDSSGNGKDGTDTNILYHDGRFEEGAHYTTGDGGISLPADTWGAIGTGDFKFASWFYGADPGSGNRPDILLSRDTDAPNYGLRVIFDPYGEVLTGDGLVFTCSTEALGTKVTSPAASKLYGRWTRILFTRVSGVCYVYYDGVLKASWADTTDIPAPDEIWINGKATTAAEAWKDGLIGDEYLIETVGAEHADVQADFGWQSIKRDCLMSRPVNGGHGLPGNKPTDRVAKPGQLTFTLRNGVESSGGVEGYYSPGHANCRAEFGRGTLFRLKFTNGTDTKYKIRAKARIIRPKSNKYGEKTVDVICADYIDDLAQAPLQKIPVQGDTYINLAINTVLGRMVISPCNMLGVLSPNGPEDYPRLLHGMTDNKSSIITALQRLCQTDKSYLFLIGDSTDGETMKWQSRHARTTDVIAAVFSDTMFAMQPELGSSLLFNNVTTIAHPCALDETPVILARTDSKEFQLRPGEANKIVMNLRFTDPTQLGRQVDMVYGSQPAGWPVADTDFKMSSTSGSGGNDLNAYLTIAVVWGANSAEVTFTNTGTAIGYVNLFHIRGLGIYDNDPIEKVRVDDDSQHQNNDHPFRLDLPYCDYDKQADNFCVAMLAEGKNPSQEVKSMTFNGHDPSNPDFASYAVNLDVGDCIALMESMSGINGDFFIQFIRWECMYDDYVRVTLENLQPARTYLPFRLCEAGDDVTDPATSILAEYDENDLENFTPTDPYGNTFHVLDV